MKTRILQTIKASSLLLALALGACGGGSDPQTQSQCSQSNLGACGGSGGLTGGGTTPGGVQPTATPKLTVALLDQAGNPANSLTSSGTLTAKVKVTNATGLPVSGSVVKFVIGDAKLATISPESNITDANGFAPVTISLASPDAVGATTINASTSYVDTAGATIALSGSANFKVGDNLSKPDSVVLVSISPADHSILMRSGAIGIERVQTAQVTFKVTGKDGQPVANQKVLFTFQPTQDLLPMSDRLTFASTSGVTGQGGEVTATVNSGTAVTVAAVKVTVVDQNDTPLLDKNGRVISSVSDQITVTNTLLNPDGITLAADKYEIEGLNVYGKTALITIALTDLQGGAITDGTAIAFTTNGGAIRGDSNSAKCTTKSGLGACTVSLVGQNPQPPESILHSDITVEPKTSTSVLLPDDIVVPKGIAVVIASLQLNGNIKKKPILISMSGSFPSFFGNFIVDFTGPPASCDPRTITFSMTDVNGNVMPVDSVLSIVGALNASGVVVNPKVKNQDPLPRGGSTHQLQVTPGSDKTPCSVTGTRTVTGSFTLLLTTPYGFETSQVVTVPYRAN